MARYKKRYERLWSIYHHLWDHYAEAVGEIITDEEYEEFKLLNSDFDGYDKVLCRGDDYTQAGLDKLATRLKRFVLFVLTECKAYDLLPPDTEVHYSANDKVILIDGERMYYLGK